MKEGQTKESFQLEKNDVLNKQSTFVTRRNNELMLIQAKKKLWEPHPVIMLCGNDTSKTDCFRMMICITAYITKLD